MSNAQGAWAGRGQPAHDEVETPETIIERAGEALEYLSAGANFLNPDCGFGTFAAGQ